MTAKQVTLLESSGEVCKGCSNFTKIEERNYCLYFSAFLAEETLVIPYGFVGVS